MFRGLKTAPHAPSRINVKGLSSPTWRRHRHLIQCVRMVFNSLTYAVFFFLTFIVYWSLKGRARIGFCLFASYVFYGWWDYRFCALIAWSTFLDYWIGLRLDRSKNPTTRRNLLVLSLFSNLGVLAFFKYSNFFIESSIRVADTLGLSLDWPTLNIILPVGISFYTFQTLSYTIDIYRRNLRPEKSLLRFATFVSFFPQLVAGPIVRASEFLPQLQHDAIFCLGNARFGVGKILLGLFKKLVIADSAAAIVDVVFANPEDFSGANTLLAVILYAFQIYCDFSGYSNIAIGSATLLGFQFPLNFRSPYFATSLSDFWNRWHISLSSWLRDYLYIPLGGNRHGKLKTYRNLILTMVLGGLWHGASWTFVVWGGLHGSYLILQRELSNLLPSQTVKERDQFLLAMICRMLVFTLVCVAWVFFRSPTFDDAWKIFESIGSYSGASYFSLRNEITLAKCLGSIGILVAGETLSEYFQLDVLLQKKPVLQLMCFASLVLGIFFLGTFGGSAFIYFQF